MAARLWQVRPRVHARNLVPGQIRAVGLGQPAYKAKRGGKMPQISRRQALLLGAALLGATSLPRGARAEKSEIAVAIQYGIGYLPVMIVDRLGLFAKQSAQRGMPATMVLQRLSGATAINDALISRSIDIGAYGIPGMLIAHEKT